MSDESVEINNATSAQPPSIVDPGVPFIRRKTSQDPTVGIVFSELGG